MSGWLLKRAGSVVFWVILLHGAWAAPKIEVDQPVWDFGTVTNLAEITHQLLVRNSGDTPLEVSRVISDCDACLRVNLEQMKIPPRGASVLHCRLDLRSFSGPISRTVALDYNDPQNALLMVVLKGVVVPAYQVTPMNIVLDMAQGQRVAMVEVVPLLKLRAPLSRVVCEGTNIIAKLVLEATNHFMLSVQALESLPRGNITFTVTLSSRNPDDPPCLIKGVIRNPPDLEVFPGQLQLRTGPEPQMRILWVKQHGPTAWVLLDAIPPSDKYQCEIIPDPGGYDYRIYLTAWHQEAMGDRTNVLTLKMRDSVHRERTVSIPISVSQAEPRSP